MQRRSIGWVLKRLMIFVQVFYVLQEIFNCSLVFCRVEKQKFNLILLFRNEVFFAVLLS